LRSEEISMNDIAYQRLRVRNETEWRTVVRAAANQFDRRMRRDPALRVIRKRFYRSVLEQHQGDRRDLFNAFRL
jgi:hypothetical protein